MNNAARHDLNKTLALFAVLLAGWSLGGLQGEVRAAPPNEVAAPRSIEKAPELAAAPGPAKQVDPRAIVTKADAEAEFGYQVGPPQIEVKAGVADCVYRKADSPSNIRVVVYAGDAAKDFQESKLTSIRLGALIEELADIGDAAYWDSERIRVLCGETHLFVEATYFDSDFSPGFQERAMERRRASAIRLARKAVERIAAGQTQLIGDELPVANDPLAAAPEQPVSRWSLERVRENTRSNHFLRGLRIGLVGIVFIAGPLWLLLVLVRRITGYTNRSNDAASEPRNPEKGGGSRLFWKGVLISAALCLVLCGAGGALAYSPKGPVDSIGGGILIFCGYLTFFVAIVVTEIHAYYGPRAPDGMAASDLIIPGARRFSISIPWSLLILVGTVGLFFVGARLIAERNLLLALTLDFSAILSWSILGITVMWSTGRRNVFASILGGAAGCAVVYGACMFFGAFLIPQKPGAEYGPIAGMLWGSLGGGIYGSVVGLVAGLGRVIWEGRNRRA